MKKSRKLAWVVLGVVVVACAFVAPKAWERVQFRAVETVFWPDGSLRLEYRWRRWGDKGASLVVWGQDGHKSETGGGGSPAILTISMRRDDGIYETFVFPGNQAVNDAVNENGEIIVEPGDRLPGIPTHSVKVGGRYELTTAWYIAVEGILASSRFFLGDEGNDQEPLEGYGLANLRSSYAFSDQVQLFGRVDNLFDAEYATFGVLAQVELELEEVPDASVPRFVSPGAPRSAFIGLRVRF